MMRGRAPFLALALAVGATGVAPCLAGAVWVANGFSGRLAAIDRSSARVVSDRPLAGLSGVAATHGMVWTFFLRKGEVAAYDAASGSQTIAPTRIRGGSAGIAARGCSIWVINALGVAPLAY